MWTCLWMRSMAAVFSAPLGTCRRGREHSQMNSKGGGGGGGGCLGALR